MTQEWLPLPDWEPDPAQRHEIARFPYDGAPILARDADGAAHEAAWRTTRAFKNGVWGFTGFWTKRNSGGAKLGFEPASYMRLEA